MEEKFEINSDRQKFLECVNALSIKIFELLYCIDSIRSTEEYNKLLANYESPKIKKPESKQTES